MTRKGEAITLSVSKYQRDKLEALAATLQLTWGDKPSISQLVKAIADNKLRVAANDNWTADRIAVLQQAWRSLQDAGQIDAAVGIAQLLLERYEVSLPLRQELEKFVAQPSKPWRSHLNALLRKHQPFELAYQDASERIWKFTVRHAEIITYEKREYLDCYCEETEGNEDLPALQHNWCFRLDRIPDVASLDPIPAKWLLELPTVEVEFHLFGRLAFAYEAKPQDVIIEWHGELAQVRRVVRRVSNSFWFLRDLRRYGADVALVNPPELRDRWLAELQQAIARHRNLS